MPHSHAPLLPHSLGPAGGEGGGDVFAFRVRSVPTSSGGSGAHSLSACHGGRSFAVLAARVVHVFRLLDGPHPDPSTSYP